MAATAAWTGHCRRTIRSRTCRRENRELLLELCGMAARTFRHRVRAHEGLELIAAGLTGVFVDRHGLFLVEAIFVLAAYASVAAAGPGILGLPDALAGFAQADCQLDLHLARGLIGPSTKAISDTCRSISAIDARS